MYFFDKEYVSRVYINVQMCARVCKGLEKETDIQTETEKRKSVWKLHYRVFGRDVLCPLCLYFLS